MSMARYDLETTILDHADPISDVAFSDDGLYLASADNSGLLLITALAPSDGKRGSLAKYYFKDSITCLMWIPQSHCLYIGLSNCELHFLSLDKRTEEKLYFSSFAPEGYSEMSKDWKSNIQLSCLSLEPSSARLAIGISVLAVVIKVGDPFKAGHHEEISSLGWLDRALLLKPPPTKLEKEVRSIHLLPGGQELLVTFYEAGIACFNVETCSELWRIDPESDRIGRSAVDSANRFIVCSNLFDGFDIYDLKYRKYKRTIQNKYDKDQNAVLPVLFVNNDSDILTGSTKGKVMVASVTDDSKVTRLDHGAEMIQSIVRVQAFVRTRSSLTYIATGSRGPGYAMVKLWGKRRHTRARALAEAHVQVPGKCSPQTKPDCKDVNRFSHFSTPSSASSAGKALTHRSSSAATPSSSSFKGKALTHRSSSTEPHSRKLIMKSSPLLSRRAVGQGLPLRRGTKPSSNAPIRADHDGVQNIRRGAIATSSQDIKPTVVISPVDEAALGSGESGEATAQPHREPPKPLVYRMLNIIGFLLRVILLSLSAFVFALCMFCLITV
ncbi:hypothetical protein D9611_008600 [Ephemerocybe angulata]|uniref:Uncharacterized protein n=1 Tax=Ephemerocybe angulata TaxID=980116 RepID=A0A8H5AZK9_9AGAR|nr:hypothetical protein D9611_008600 [Tulosesus angulatus]